jgi:hypothetical protein
MGNTAYTLSNLHQSLATQGLHEWYLNCDWYGSLNAGVEPMLTPVLFRPASPDQLSGTTYILDCCESRLDITSSVPVNTCKPQFEGDLLTIIPIGSRSPCFQQRGFLPLSRESIKAFFDNAYHASSANPIPDTKLSKAWRHLVALLIDRTTANSPQSPNTSKRALSTELESFLTELAAELHSTPEAAEQIWKGYHPEQEATHVEPQKSSSLSAAARVSDRCPQNTRF